MMDPRRLFPLLAGLTVLAACGFEKRPDIDGAGQWNAEPPEPPEPSGAVEGSRAAQDSVWAVVASFRRALEVGDVARVAQLTLPRTVLLDREESVRWGRPTADSALPTRLDAGGELAWTRTDSTVVFLDDGVALVVDEFRVRVAADTVPWSATETLVLVRSPEGWRLRHMHRSRGERR